MAGEDRITPSSGNDRISLINQFLGADSDGGTKITSKEGEVIKKKVYRGATPDEIKQAAQRLKELGAIVPDDRGNAVFRAYAKLKSDGKTALGDAGRAGDLGTHGTGPGGGDHAWGISLGTGTGRGSSGTGEVDLGGREKGLTKVTPGTIAVEGKCNNIDRTVHRYLSQIKFCYEKELNRNPKLEGTVTIGFTVDKMGRTKDVGVVKESSLLNNAAVKDCIIKIFERMTFPPPKGVGENATCRKTHLFIFQASGN